MFTKAQFYKNKTLQLNNQNHLNCRGHKYNNGY